MHDMMDQLFSDHFLTPFSRWDSALLGNVDSFSPKVDISETDTDIKVRAEIPGIDPKDVNIEVTDDSILLSGKIEKSTEEKEENYYRAERSYGQFSREFTLPLKVDTESVSADSKNGVITVTLKKQPSEQKKKVEIKV
tara:strand:- start:161 stop:574 length:414 start_codon:yes stop_codon:yes gene_type:complete